MRSFDEIVELLAERKKQRHPVLSQMQKVKATYNAEMAVPLPELNASEEIAVANLLKQGVDQYGQRIGSTMPAVWFPSEKAGVKVQEDAARDRRTVGLGWWEENAMNLQLPLRGRHYVAYGTAPVVVAWNAQREAPVWVPQDPLGTFPAPPAHPGDMHPEDVIFTNFWPASRLQREYPAQYRALRKGPNVGADSMFELVRYLDYDQIVLGVIGVKDTPWHSDGSDGTFPWQILEETRNYAETCPAVVPSRITLDRLGGQFDGMIGMYLQEAEFMALTSIAARKSIFPDLWLVSENGTAKIIKQANGMLGQVGTVQGGSLTVVSPQPGYLTMPAQDRLRENQRLTGGIPADLTGEAGTNVRTGRRASQLVSAVVDFPVQEAQNVLAESLKHEMKVAIAMDKAMSPDRVKTVFVSWPGANGKVEYTPKKLWTNDKVSIDYAYAGADANGLSIEVGSQVGMGTLSKRSAMRVLPLVKDPEYEHDQVVAEALETAMLQGLQSQAASGQIPPSDIARIMELVASDRLSLAEAVANVQREAQERQAAQVPAEAPEAQPGIAMPGAGAESATIEKPDASLGNLNSLLMQLRGPQMQSQAELASAAG